MAKYSFKAGWIVFTLAAGATIPSTIIPRYEQMFHMSIGLTELTFVVYGLALLPTLIYFGPLSDKVGRKTILIVGSSLMMVPTFLLGYPANIFSIMVARALQGALLGMLLGTSTAFFINQADPKTAPDAARLSGFVMTFGYALGPAISGTALLLHGSLASPFVVNAIMLALAILFVSIAPEAKRRTISKRNTTKHSNPINKRAFMRIIALPAFSIFAVGNVSLSVLPIYVHTVFNLPKAVENAFYGYTEMSLFVVAAVAQILVAKWPLKKVMAVGLVAEGFGQVILSIGGLLSSIAVLLLAVIIIGAGFGLTIMATIRKANELAHPDNLGKVLAFTYASQYIGFIIPTLTVGYLSDVYGLRDTFVDFGVFMVVFVLLAALLGNYISVPQRTNSNRTSS